MDEPTMPLPQPTPAMVFKPEIARTTLPMPGYRPPSAPPFVPNSPPLPPNQLQRVGSGWRWFRRSMLLVLVLVVLMMSVFVHRAYDFGAAISTQSPFSSQLSGTGRVSIVFLGYGGEGHDGPYLTDSLLVLTFDHASGKSALISVPRDLWVQVPPSSGQYAKLNTAYSYGFYKGGPNLGGSIAAQKVSEILGINVPYWLSLDFTGFAQLVDKLGGVDINVPNDFHASLSPTYAPFTVFHHGVQHMDGAQALLFARARYNSPAAEASDFARSVRQQILIKALVSKMRSPLAWIAIPGVMDALQTRVHTNLSLRDLTTLFTQSDLAQALHIGLTNQNVLIDATVAGQAILLPAQNDWSVIVDYVQTQLQQ